MYSFPQACHLYQGCWHLEFFPPHKITDITTTKLCGRHEKKEDRYARLFPISFPLSEQWEWDGRPDDLDM